MNNETQNGGLERVKSSLDGTRRLLPWVGGGLLIFVVGGYFFFGATSHAPQSAQITHPDMKSPAGGANHSKAMDELARKRDEEASQAARKAGKSYTSTLSGQDLPDPRGIIAEIGDTPDSNQKPAAPPPPPPAPHTAPTPAVASPAPSFAPSTARPANNHFNTAGREKSPEPGQMSERAQMELIAAWSGGPPLYIQISSAERGRGDFGP
ncbi:hypothetical protein [Acetobacter orientalis]|uniref:hypothetical protein n=1 Tax=Acetobacter orientalis TaxID=146474 RepID=UPI0039E90DEC